MKRGIFNLFFSLTVVFVSLISFHCGMPNDPTDPSNTSITAIFKDVMSKVYDNSIVDTVGKPIDIGAALYLPKNFDSISLVITENGIVTTDTTFKTFKDEYFYDTAWCTRTFSTDGVKNVTMTPFSTPSLNPLSINIPIFARPTLVHISFVKNAASATGTMPVKTFTSSETITLPENVFVNPEYKFFGWTTTATGSVEYTDKSEITLGKEDLLLYAVWVDQNSVVPTVVNAPSQHVSGNADTLLFAVDNSSRTEPLTISLATDTPLDSAVFSIVPTEPDTIMIGIAQSAQATSVIIEVVVSDGTKSDTTKFPITIVNADDALWNTTILNLDAVEGSLSELDLSQYLSDTNREDVLLSADIGTIESNIWSYTPEWGCAEELTATITAMKGDESLALSLNITVAAGDDKKPQITLVDESLDGKMVSSSQLNVECKAIDEGAGVESVVFTYGEQNITGILQGENVYSGIITGLVHNTQTQITITATDKSRQKNSETLTFTVTRDSTILDAEPPVIVKTSGPESGARVNSPKDTLTFNVSDNAGVDSVWWTLNDAFVAAVSTSGDNNYTIIYTLTDFGKNVIKLYAKDGSSDRNEGSQTITLNYNTEPTAATPSGPDDGAAGVSLTPSFTWTGGTDADGDSVFYQVFYGPSEADLSEMTSVLTSKTVTLTSAEQLSPKTKYYWRVIAWSKTFADTVQSEVISFTTLDPTAEDQNGPQIAQTAGPVDGDRVTSATDTITVSVTDPSSITSVTAKLNDGIARTLTAGANNTYAYSYTLNTSGENKVTFTAIDGSANSNSSTKTISINYNTEPTAITLTTPDANATGVSTSPTFKWSGGDDADGDVVMFTVNYGTSQTSLSSTATVNGKTATPSSALEYAKTYYWQVMATSSSADYLDEIQSSVGTFTTEGSLPTISDNPQSQTVEEGQSVEFKVAAEGFGTFSYQWRENEKDIDGATSSSYVISSVTTSMNNNTYDCVVKNEVGSDTSTAAILKVTTIPTFKVSFVTDGGTPEPDTLTVTSGGLATKPTTDPVRDGYKFTGWYELNATHDFYFTTTTITADLTIYAGWKKVYTVTYHKNTDESGDVPTGPAEYDSGTVVTIAGNTNNLTKDGYRFIGWTTSQDGSGSAITTISVTSNIDLYPMWELERYTITYNANQGSGSVPTSTATYTRNQTATVLANTGKLVKNGASFCGWNTSSNGNGTDYACGATLTIGSSDIILYAKYSTVKVMDNDGNLYDAVTIGAQTWMVQNLKTTKYNDGTAIPYVNDLSTWVSATTAAYGFNDLNQYGAVYNAYAVETSKLAPAGWKVPSDDDFSQLVAYLNSTSSSKGDSATCSLKATGITAWDTVCATNSSGFTAIPAPYYSSNGWNNIGDNTTFWTSTFYSTESYRTFSIFTKMLLYMPSAAYIGHCVRCIKE